LFLQKKGAIVTSFYQRKKRKMEAFVLQHLWGGEVKLEIRREKRVSLGGFHFTTGENVKTLTY